MFFSRRDTLKALGALPVVALSSRSVGAASSLLRTGAPTSIAIPTAGILAPIEPVWLALPAGPETGADQLVAATTGTPIGLPSTPDSVGWYALGALPGEAGSALLVGHVDTVAGPAVFTRLPEVFPGTTVHLTTAQGESTFVVENVRRHPAHLPAPAELFALDGEARLYLITCTGRFIRSAGGYQERLIVSASFLPSELATP
ncbi:MAG TPA: class F sortase [Chloroflexota bacterium]|nr:class F sortase [Chloroflexota bacterium]